MFPCTETVPDTSNLNVAPNVVAHMREVLRWAPTLQDAAAILGIDKATLYRKRKRFGME